MKELIKKTTNWYVEHKKEIIETTARLVIGAGCFSAGYFTAEKICSMRTGAGMAALEADGFIKFFNPANNQEVSFEDALSLTRKHYQK